MSRTWGSTGLQRRPGRAALGEVLESGSRAGCGRARPGRGAGATGSPPSRHAPRPAARRIQATRPALDDRAGLHRPLPGLVEPLTAADGHAVVREAVEEVHGAVDRVEHPRDARRALGVRRPPRPARRRRGEARRGVRASCRSASMSTAVTGSMSLDLVRATESPPERAASIICPTSWARARAMESSSLGSVMPPSSRTCGPRPSARVLITRPRAYDALGAARDTLTA